MKRPSGISEALGRPAMPLNLTLDQALTGPPLSLNNPINSFQARLGQVAEALPI